jgi:hypothetical protein
MKSISKESLPIAVAESIKEVGCKPADFPDLALRLLMSRAIELPPAAPAGVAKGDMMQWLIVNPGKTSGTRVARNAMNPLNVAGAVLASASAATDSVGVTSCIALVVAIAGACSATLTKDQAALLLALKRLENEQKIRSAVAVATRMSNSLGRPVSQTDALAVVAQLQGVGVPFEISPAPHHVIHCKEATTLLPYSGP